MGRRDRHHQQSGIQAQAQPRTDKHTLPQSHAHRPLRGVYGGMVHPAYAWRTRHDHRGSFAGPNTRADPRSGPSTSCLTSLPVNPDSSFSLGFSPHPCASLRPCQPGLTAFQSLTLASRRCQSSLTAFPAVASCLASMSTKPDDPSGFEPDRTGLTAFPGLAGRPCLPNLTGDSLCFLLDACVSQA